MTRSTSRQLSTLLAPLALVGTAALAWLQWRGVTKGIWVDSDVYVMGARTLMQGGDLYANATSVDLRFTYAPFAAAMFVPLALLPVEAARCTLTLVSLISLLVTVLVVGRRLDLKPWLMVWLVLATAALEPVMRNLLLGQINLVLMALIVVDLLAIPQRYRGVLVGVAAGIKLTPLVFLVYFVLQKDWRSAIRSAAAFGMTVVIGFVISPPSSRSFWGGGFMGLGKFGAEAVVGTDNQSLLAGVSRVLGQQALPVAAQAALAVVGVTLGALAARRCLARGGPVAQVEAVAWIALGGLLASPISWTHHWVWVILVLAVLARRQRPLAAAALLFLFWFPTVWILYAVGNFEVLTFPWWKAVLSAVYVIAGLTVLLNEVIPLFRPLVARPLREPAADASN